MERRNPTKAGASSYSTTPIPRSGLVQLPLSYMICSPSPAAPRQAIMPDRSLTCSRAGGSKIPSQPVFFQRLDEILEALGEIDSSHLDRHSSRIATGAAIPSGRRMRTTGGRSPVETRGASRPIRGSWIASPPTFVFSLFCMTAWPRWTTRAASEMPSQALRWASSGSTGSATTASLPASRTARCASSS